MRHSVGEDTLRPLQNPTHNLNYQMKLRIDIILCAWELLLFNDILGRYESYWISLNAYLVEADAQEIESFFCKSIY